MQGPQGCNSGTAFQKYRIKYRIHNQIENVDVHARGNNKIQKLNGLRSRRGSIWLADGGFLCFVTSFIYVFMYHCLFNN